jgi:hypothetical protein
MDVQIDDELEIRVSFDVFGREEGHDGDIRLALRQSGDKRMWLFSSDEIFVLLTPDQAERLAAGLAQAVEASRNTPR